jgi:7-carboxy-7-deazaguanine synthase
MISINEIFCSLDGEVNAFGQGRRTVFIRFQGCNLACKWCDQPEAIKSVDIQHYNWTLSEVLRKVDSLECSKVTITGGEPLVQYEALLELICELKKTEYYISVETNGSLNVDPLMVSLVDSWVVDFKPFYEYADFRFPYHLLDMNDWIKFVITNKEDFIESLSVKYEIDMDKQTNFAWSAVYPHITNTQLADLMMTYKVNGNLNVQLHKLLNVR